ncbi:MAG: hypothetical protein Ct9H90mP9_1950 [Pseudomonadota bacterium]|nr:MAG: hypothetical protein Ct9H90mP9_1950 [Pseudomonadota bacterium]
MLIESSKVKNQSRFAMLIAFECQVDLDQKCLPGKPVEQSNKGIPAFSKGIKGDAVKDQCCSEKTGDRPGQWMEGGLFPDQFKIEYKMR